MGVHYILCFCSKASIANLERRVHEIEIEGSCDGPQKDETAFLSLSTLSTLYLRYLLYLLMVARIAGRWAKPLSRTLATSKCSRRTLRGLCRSGGGTIYSPSGAEEQSRYSNENPWPRGRLPNARNEDGVEGRAPVSAA